MYVHQYAKGEPNWSTDGTVIGPNVHTHSSLTQTSLFLLFLDLHLNIYLYIYPYIWATKIAELTNTPLCAF